MTGPGSPLPGCPLSSRWKIDAPSELLPTSISPNEFTKPFTQTAWQTHNHPIAKGVSFSSVVTHELGTTNCHARGRMDKMRLLKLTLGSFALVCSVATTAAAQDAAPADAATVPAENSTATLTPDAQVAGKIVVGARLGYAIGMGKLTDVDGADMSEYIKGNVPMVLDLGYMVTPNIMVGLYGQYGIGLPAMDECDQSGIDCSASIIRLGLQGQYHVSPAKTLDPWFGLGIGYEWASLTMEGGGAKMVSDSRGFEFLNLQAGLDYKLMPALGIGPFLSFSLGQYANYNLEVSGTGILDGSDSGSIDEQAMHEWLTFGVRGNFTL